MTAKELIWGARHLSPEETSKLISECLDSQFKHIDKSSDQYVKCSQIQYAIICAPLSMEEKSVLEERLTKLREIRLAEQPKKLVSLKRLKRIRVMPKNRPPKMSKEKLASLWKIHGGNDVAYTEPACVIYNHNGRKRR